MLLSRRYPWLRDQLVSGQLLLRNAHFMARYMSTVASDDIRSAHFAMELLFLREHSWEFNNSMSFSGDEIDDLLSAVLTYTVSQKKKRHPFYFCDNSVRCHSILPILGRNIPQGI